MAVEMNEQYLDRDIINLTGNKDEERTGARTHGSDPGVVQEGGDVMPPPQESMDNGSSLFDYRLDDAYMTSLMTLTHTWSMARDTRTGRHLKMLFTDSGTAIQLTCGVTHTMTHHDSQ